jgi:hypothetical protein
METFLNLVWLAVTVAALWLWRFRWTVSRQAPKHSTRMEAVAMVSVLALLFPVISLTDDLHPETVAVDAASGKRNACLIVANGAQTGNSKAPLNLHPFFALPTHSPAEIEFGFVGPVPTPRFPGPTGLSAAEFGRSPPSLD